MQLLVVKEVEAARVGIVGGGGRPALTRRPTQELEAALASLDPAGQSSDELT